MSAFKVSTSLSNTHRILWFGFGISVFSWIFEAAIHVFILHEGTFGSQLITRDLHELWKRCLILALIFIAAFYANLRLNEGIIKDKTIKETEHKYQLLFQEALVPIFIFDDTGNLIDFNHAGEDFFECHREFLMGRQLWNHAIQNMGKMETAEKKTFLTAANDIEIEFNLNGSVKTLLLNLIPASYDFGQRSVYAIGKDITARKEMEREILLAHSELNQIFQTASVGMRLIDLDFNILKANEAFASLSGVDAKTAVGQKCHAVFRGDLCHRDVCPLQKLSKGEASTEITQEVTKYRTDGTLIHCLLTVRPFWGPNNELKGIVESFKNINDLKKFQQDLRNEHDKFKRILFHRPDGVGILAPDYTIEYLNESLKSQMGDHHGRKCYSYFRGYDQPCDDCLMLKAFLSEKTECSEFNAENDRIYEQTYTPFEESDGRQKVLVTLRDITDIKIARAVTYRSEQLAALGELAAGVAHEINNPINGIINYAQILINENNLNEKNLDITKRIRKESNRVAQIVECLLSFARRERQSKIPVHINEILDDALALIGTQMRREAISIQANIQPDLPLIFAIPQEIQQVFINILSNARYSLNKRYPKKHKDKMIQIEAERVTFDDKACVRISFLDFGIGFSPDIIEKVMNPFFSTKPKGVGTGLGLSISHGIIAEHAGKMTIDGQEYDFAKVIIDLPAAPAANVKG